MNKQTKKPLWFKRRRYGYGWTPVTWQGWLSIGGFLAVVLVVAPFIVISESNGARWLYLNFIFSAALFLIGISLSKGPLPKWRCGKSDGDNPDEDY